MRSRVILTILCIVPATVLTLYIVEYLLTGRSENIDERLLRFSMRAIILIALYSLVGVIERIFDRKRLPVYSRLVFHFLFNIVFIVLYFLLFYLSILLFAIKLRGSVGTSLREVLFYFPYDLFWYWGAIGIQYLVRRIELFNKQRLLLSEAEDDASLVRLEMLKMQLHPHFIFNSLNTISSLIHTEPDKARNVSKDLLSLVHGFFVEEAKCDTLEEEMRLVETYLNIEKSRFGGKLLFKMYMSPGTEPCIIPRLTVSTLAENFIKHNISAHSDVGILHISSSLQEGRLILKIVENGTGYNLLDVLNKESSGLGLRNLVNRLDIFYKNQYEFETETRNDRFCITLRLPLEKGMKS